MVAVLKLVTFVSFTEASLNRTQLAEVDAKSQRSRSPHARSESRLYHFDCARRVNSGDHLNQIGSAPGVRQRALEIALTGAKLRLHRGGGIASASVSSIADFTS